MTTFSYRIDMNEIEAIAVEEALLKYLELCEKGEADREPKTRNPHPRAIKEVLSRLRSSMTLTSTNNFFRRTPPSP